MTEENTETTEVEETEQDTSEPVESEEVDATDEDDSSEATELDNIDYKKVAEEERERRIKAEKAAADRAFKRRNERRQEVVEDEVDSDESDEDRPLTMSELKAVLAEDRQERVREAQSEKALQIARENTSSEEEAQAALEFYRGRIVPTGNTEEDMLGAIALMNRKRIQAQKSEVARAQRNVDTTSKESAQPHRAAPEGTEPKLTSADATAIKSSGMTWNGKTRLYEKKIGGGKIYYFNPKTKQRGTR